ncbi:MAG: YbhB/YbcL family Raf kinase inhibitor-like protein [Burkholderiales bacterium]|nr:YbhB/YbcL family Raf kinase inhibitor-like protein [Burkholderiales bacterium]
MFIRLIPRLIPPIAAAALCCASLAAQAEPFTLTSPDITEGRSLLATQVLQGFGCSGGNQSPALQWQGVPPGTQSLALTVYDPDAPTGSGWWHWVVYNLPANTSGLPAQAGSGQPGLPAGTVQGRTDFGAPGYGGACPPAGDQPHRYIFTLYALKVPRIDLPADASAAMVGFMLHANTLAQTRLTAIYGR